MSRLVNVGISLPPVHRGGTLEFVVMCVLVCNAQLTLNHFYIIASLLSDDS